MEVLGAVAVLALTGVTFFVAVTGFVAVDGLLDVAAAPVFLIAPGFGADETFFTGAVAAFFFKGVAVDMVLGAGSAFFGAAPSTFF